MCCVWTSEQTATSALFIIYRLVLYNGSEACSLLGTHLFLKLNRTCCFLWRVNLWLMTLVVRSLILVIENLPTIAIFPNTLITYWNSDCYRVDYFYRKSLMEPSNTQWYRTAVGVNYGFTSSILCISRRFVTHIACLKFSGPCVTGDTNIYNLWPNQLALSKNILHNPLV